MLRRTITYLALLAVALPGLARAQSREWEEDYYGDEPRSEAPPPGDYDVSVEVGDGGSAPVETFYEPLSPYGQWVTVGGYGRVWRPHVAAGWRPYYYGRWEWTNEGWLWVSDEPWGWAAYHYGRWTFDPSFGWVWIPGSQWAPAWVAWRYSGDVVGWAPLGPGVSVYVSAYPFVDTWWTFVPTGRFCSYPVYDVAYAPGYTRRFFHETQPAPPRPRAVPGRSVGTPAWGGPAPRTVEQRMGRTISPVRVVPAPRPGAATRPSPGEVSVFRPGIRPAPGGGRETYVPRGGAQERPFPTGPRRDDGARPGPGSGPGRVAPAPSPGRGGGERPTPRVREERGTAPAPVYQPHAESRPSQPVYRSESRPAPVYRAPVESRPAPVYRAPESRPAPVYRAPVESRPAPVYRAPESRPAPAAPSGGGHGGGGGHVRSTGGREHR